MPAIETLEKWTKSLGITMSQLFAENGEDAKPLTGLKTNTPKLDRAAQNSLRRVGEAFARMKKRDIDLVTGMARQLAKQQ